MPAIDVYAADEGRPAMQLVVDGNANDIAGAQASSVWFGNYPQSSNGNGGFNVDPVKWRVLAKEDSRLFLLADQILDIKQYHGRTVSVTWKDCDLRAWLNGTSGQASTAGVQEEEPVDAIGPISYRWGHFYSPYGILYDDDLDYYLGMSMFGSDYRKALSRYSWGEWLTVGGAMTIASCIIAGIADSGLDRIANYHGMQPSGSGDGVISATALFGAVCLGAGIPLWISGNRRLNQLADEYNQSHRGRSYGSAVPATLQLGPTRNGLGLALNF